MPTDKQQTIYPEQGDVHAEVRLLPFFSLAWKEASIARRATPSEH